MYGKRFIAAMMFLAVADNEVNAYGHYGGYGDYGGYGEETTGGDGGYLEIPEPAGNFTIDYAVDVPIPEGDFDIYSAVMEMYMIEDDDPVWKWAETNLEEDSLYHPTGYALRGEIMAYDDATGDLHAVGINNGYESMPMAVMEGAGDNFYTIYFDGNDFEEDGDFASKPAFLDNEPVTSGVTGAGDEFGQALKRAEKTWCIWSYDDGYGEWDHGDYTFYYVEGNMGAFAGFSTDIYLDYMGAKQLLATTATASLLLAFM